MHVAECLPDRRACLATDYRLYCTVQSILLGWHLGGHSNKLGTLCCGYN